MAESYYIPAPSHWPLVTATGLTLMLGGFAHLLHGGSYAPMLFGALLLLYAVAGWFGTVVDENQSGRYGEQVDQSFRWGMVWFIFSEVMFFGVLFGALFFLREFAVPWLGGHGAKGATHILWPDFAANWPLMKLPEGKGFNLPKGAVGAAGIPAFNTFILLTSGLTVTLAHWGLRRGARRRVTFWLIVTIALGAAFVGLQAREYAHAYRELNLTLHSGVYASTFYLLTGFHGFHVCIGLVMLSVMLGRTLRGHFTPRHHFGFEAASWYWHFVDVVWLFLFVFVYWL